MKLVVNTIDELRSKLSGDCSNLEEIALSPKKVRSFKDLDSWKDREKIHLPKITGKKWTDESGRRCELVSAKKLKKIIENDSSIKTRDGGFYFNSSVSYYPENPWDTDEEVRDHYFSQGNNTVKTDDKDFIKNLVWDKNARLIDVNGKSVLAYDGKVYDGGEFAVIEKKNRSREEARKQKIMDVEKARSFFKSTIDDVLKDVAENYAVKITGEAKEKSHRISEEMVNMTGPNEIYMQGLNFLDKKNDPAIRDVFIPGGQIAHDSNCSVVEGMNENLKKVSDEGKYVYSWIHSHANMGVSHSSTDDGNLKGETRSRFGKKIKFELNNGNYKFNTTISVNPSLVFNAKRSEPYLKVGVGADSTGPEGEISSLYASKEKRNLEVIDEINNISLSRDRIMREIPEKVLWWPGKRISRELEERIKDHPMYYQTHARSLRDLKSRKERKGPVYNKDLDKENSFVPVPEIKENNKRPLSERVSYLEKSYNEIAKRFNDFVFKIKDYLPGTKEASLTK